MKLSQETIDKIDELVEMADQENEISLEATGVLSDLCSEFEGAFSSEEMKLYESVKAEFKLRFAAKLLDKDVEQLRLVV